MYNNNLRIIMRSLLVILVAFMCLTNVLCAPLSSSSEEKPDNGNQEPQSVENDWSESLNNLELKKEILRFLLKEISAQTNKRDQIEQDEAINFRRGLADLFAPKKPSAPTTQRLGSQAWHERSSSWFWQINTL